MFAFFILSNSSAYEPICYSISQKPTARNIFRYYGLLVTVINTL